MLLVVMVERRDKTANTSYSKVWAFLHSCDFHGGALAPMSFLFPPGCVLNLPIESRLLSSTAGVQLAAGFWSLNQPASKDQVESSR